ncbi:uncharacterized protein LOC104877986 [Vitis vinifera]|uniref:uncharacterized protein LOC104877986 n=1 Tax=Vitis vinifera TaxID=29760 RepID=UPI00053FD003|nr:uncharacterized protein LOC104877986 [Vitis vinifera]|eukprot:XP_010645935.1 PREDICTED: uncharacterized protein LOC104877986 [Vitis vinifera]
MRSPDEENGHSRSPSPIPRNDASLADEYESCEISGPDSEVVVDKETELVTKAQNQRSKFQVAIDDKYWNDSLSAVHSDERNLKQTLNGQMLMAQPETMHPGSHDDFDDLYGLSNQVAHYDHAFDLILDVEFSHGDSPTEKQNEIVESVAKALWSVSFLLLIDLAKTDCHAKRARRL